MNLPFHFLKLTIRSSRTKIFSSSVFMFCKHSTANTSMPDALTMLTDHLIQRRIERRLDSGSELLESDKNYNFLLNLNLNEGEMELLDTLKMYLKKYIDRHDVPAKPPIKLLNTLAYYFIQRNDLEGLQLIINVHKLDYEEFAKHGEYKHLLIDYYGNNNQIDACFDIINSFYKETQHLHFMMKLSIKKLIFAVVTNRSEASLVKLVDHVKTFSIQSHEYYPLLILWKCLFTSEWHSDQMEAKDLLRAFPPLQVYVSVICVSFCIELLNEKKVHAVESLLEYFLAMKNAPDGEEKFKKQCVLILRLLFDYQCLARNLRACTEIVKTSYELDLSLTEDQKVQFFNVLLKKPIEKKLITPRHKTIYPLNF